MITDEEIDVVVEWTLAQAKKAIGLDEHDTGPTLEQWLAAMPFIERARKLLPPEKKKRRGRTSKGSSESAPSVSGDNG
jgi:hypothetical protein